MTANNARTTAPNPSPSDFQWRLIGGDLIDHGARYAHDPAALSDEQVLINVEYRAMHPPCAPSHARLPAHHDCTAASHP
jgi:hypothetical protein